MHLKLAAGNGGFSRVIQPVAAAGSDPAQLRADCVLHGARGGSRTRTPLRALAPEASESTNSTTRASIFG